MERVQIRRLSDDHVSEADRIFRLAFGTFLGLPEPLKFGADGALVPTRCRNAAVVALGAYEGDMLIGSNLVTHWGSFGFFGPLTVRPDRWDAGIASRLMDETMAVFAGWGVQQTGLFTFPHSARHIGLYQKYGFGPQYLTPLLTRRVERGGAVPATVFSRLPATDREVSLDACRRITNEIFGGLDVSDEIRSVAAQQIGDTVLLQGDGGLVGFAVCHIGAGSEARSGSAYVKFGAVRPGSDASRRLDELAAACEAAAAAQGAEQLVAGVNTAREGAYRTLLARGYRIAAVGVAMQRPNATGFNRSDCFVMDDWR